MSFALACTLPHGPSWPYGRDRPRPPSVVPSNFGRQQVAGTSWLPGTFMRSCPAWPPNNGPRSVRVDCLEWSSMTMFAVVGSSRLEWSMTRREHLQLGTGIPREFGFFSMCWEWSMALWLTFGYSQVFADCF